MQDSIFSLFSIGIGPSSSHTVGPMRTSLLFVDFLQQEKILNKVETLVVELYGSLAMTGKGHGTDRAIILGLSGEIPETIDVDQVQEKLATIAQNSQLEIAGHKIPFSPDQNIVFLRGKSLDYHPNALSYAAFDKDNNRLCCRIYYSVGGGFVEEEGKQNLSLTQKETSYYASAEKLLNDAKLEDLPISKLVLKNELKLGFPEKEIRQRLDLIWSTMQETIQRGIKAEGVLPGSLKVKRRAHKIYKNLTENPEKSLRDPLSTIDWINLYALAVSEENAAGGKIVTAPTNGAAGIIPAVLNYYFHFCKGSDQVGIENFLMTAGAIGILYKNNASISGADVGCQGEVGVASSMAAAGLTEVLGGTVEQVENAAEIAMEHNLGLTCDPIGGLVQVPCIERNAMGAVKAINAARIALQGTGEHLVSLDKVIKTMRETGKDMQSKYKETSRGGLAVNITEC